MTSSPKRSDGLLTRRTDLLSILILTIACLTLRLPTLTVISLNPDESQYEATAAYMIAANESSFALPFTTAGTLALYKVFAWIFGPYAMYEIRLLVLLICLSTALLLYAILRQQVHWWAALAGGLVFLHLNVPFEGYSANREWFSGLFILIGVFLYSIAERRGERQAIHLAFWAGVAGGFAIWFKIQAVLIVPAVPLAMLWDGIRLRRLLPATYRIAANAAGGMLAVALYLAQFLRAGTLGEFLGWLTPSWNQYVMQNEQTVLAGTQGGAGLYIEHFFWGLPFRSVFLVAYAVAALVLGTALVRLVRRREPADVEFPGSTTVAFVAYLLCSMLAIKLGNRFFHHYYLFMLPAVAALFGIAVHALGTAGRGARLVWGSGLALFGLLAAERLVSLRFYPHAVAVAIVGLYLVVFVSVIASLRVRPGWIGPILASLLAFEAGMLSLTIQLADRPGPLPLHRSGFSSLARFFENERARPEDRLFVWGWCPEIYSVTRLEPASLLTITQDVVHDEVARPTETRLNPEFADKMMHDLRSRKPKYIVDASRTSWTMAENNDPWLYRLELYPEFEFAEFLETRYVRRGRFDQCDVYVRRSMVAEVPK